MCSIYLAPPGKNILYNCHTSRILEQSLWNISLCKYDGQLFVKLLNLYETFWDCNFLKKVLRFRLLKVYILSIYMQESNNYYFYTMSM